MNTRKLLEYGGLLAGVVLIAFGIGALWLSFDARSTVQDELAREQIVGGDDMSPGRHPARDRRGWPGRLRSRLRRRRRGDRHRDEARCFSQYMRIHALEGSGGLTYAQMGRFLAADDPENPAGTSDEAAALTDEEGNPVPNQARNTWVTATALSTALNQSYMAAAARAVRHRRRDRARSSPASASWCSRSAAHFATPTPPRQQASRRRLSRSRTDSPPPPASCAGSPIPRSAARRFFSASRRPSRPGRRRRPPR